MYSNLLGYKYILLMLYMYIIFACMFLCGSKFQCAHLLWLYWRSNRRQYPVQSIPLCIAATVCGVCVTLGYAWVRTFLILEWTSLI